MEHFEEIHQEPGARAIRRDANIRVVFDSLGTRKDIVLDGKVITVAEDGSLDSATVSAAIFYHCKHPASDPMGSQCGELGCSNISCRACSVDCFCSVCLKPLCLEHLEQVETPEGIVKFCGRCKARFLRKQRWHSITRLILKPFVDFDGRESS